MPQIRRLPETLVNRIAAGEVVERPAAALKELVENAVDAGATRIAVSWPKAGWRRIEVTDDGCGMAPEEMALALERHATSKLPESLIGEEGAIEQVTTLGFRGEALPSIASVARLTLESRPRDAEQGWRRVVDHGALARRRARGVSARHAGAGRAIVRQSARAAQVPAQRAQRICRLPRRRAPAGDGAARISPSVSSMAAGGSSRCRRGIRPKRGWRRSSPANWRKMPYRLHSNAAAMRLGGVAGLPTYNRGVADHQYLFVNGRPVKDRLLIGAVRGAYADMLARDRHAVLALFLELPPEEVDVNVHPAKTEVRFRDAAGVRGFIVTALRQALATRRQTQRAGARWRGDGALGAGRGPAGSAARRTRCGLALDLQRARLVRPAIAGERSRQGMAILRAGSPCRAAGQGRGGR